MNPDETLVAEEQSWILSDPAIQHDKLQRERIRHYKLVKDLLLDKLDTSNMYVLEIGGGPMPISDLIPFKSRTVIEPLAESYKKIAPCHDHLSGFGEEMEVHHAYDLAIATNSLDHCNEPVEVMLRVAAALKPGGFFAVLCAENNALTHPHPAHAHNIDAHVVHQALDADFETVHELTYLKDGYRYGHVLYQGRRGQPAFALLLRKCSGYQ